MNRIGKFLALLSVGAMTAVAPLSSANAQGDFASANGWAPQDSIMAGDPNGSRPYWHYRHGRKYYHHHYRPHRSYRGGNDGLAIGLGIAAGAIALGAIANSRTIHTPPPAVRSRGGMQPWTPAWYRYCDRKYKTFNARTGTYRGFDGQDHFCVTN